MAMMGVVAALGGVRASASAQEHVLVRRETFFHARPDASSERARDPWAGRHELRLGPFWAMSFVAERDGWIEVASMPGFRAGEHCYGTASGLAGLDVHLFVRASDVAPVTPRAVRRAFDDGSAVTLVAGVGLEPRGRNRFDARVRGASLRVELAPDQVATRYGVTEPIAVSRESIALLAPGASVDLGRGGRIETETADRAQRASRGVVTFDASETGRRSADGPPRTQLAVQATTTTGGHIAATVRSSCLEATGWVRGRDLTTERPARAAADLGEHRGTTVRAGAALYWADGTRAGRAADVATLDGAPRPNGARTCFDHPLRADAGTAGRPADDDVLTLCVDRDALSRPARASRFGR